MNVQRSFTRLGIKCKAFGGAGVEGVTGSAIVSAMNESERGTRLLYLPAYRSDATTEGMAHHLARILHNRKYFQGLLRQTEWVYPNDLCGTGIKCLQIHPLQDDIIQIPCTS